VGGADHGPFAPDLIEAAQEELAEAFGVLDLSTCLRSRGHEPVRQDDLMAGIDRDRGLRKDRAIAAIAEIVHDVDLKDRKFERPEAEGIRTLLAGICNGTHQDEERLARGAAVFEDLYRSFSHGRGRQQ
jgi:hypothetical protein